MDARRDQTGDVRHVHHEQGVHAVGDCAQAGKVKEARVGARAGNDELGPMLFGASRCTSS